MYTYEYCYWDLMLVSSFMGFLNPNIEKEPSAINDVDRLDKWWLVDDFSNQITLW